MNPEQLLAHFDRISEAPDAVPRLRRFILDLAVRGKLVAQDPNDEPASEVLKRIKAEKARLARKGENKKSQPLEAISDDDFSFDIPLNWKWSQLAEIGLINPRNLAADELPASFVPMTLISTDYGIASKHEIRPWGEIKSGFTHFAEGDVALAKITPCFQNGKSSVFRGLTGGIGAGTTELHVVRPLLVNPDYILIFLKSPFFIETGIPLMTGTAGQKRVATTYFANSPFPLPPLAEQHRIVTRVDELMALCDRLEAAQKERESRRDRLVAASLHRLNQPADAPAFREDVRFHLSNLPRLATRPEHIKQLRQTILNLAVRGLLVPQDPNDEPVNRALVKVQSEDRRRRKEEMAKLGVKSYRGQTERLILRDEELRISNTEGLPTLPVTWEWVCWERILAFGEGSFRRGPFGSTLTKGIFVASGYKVYEQYCPINDDCSFSRYYITPQKFIELESFAVKARDFLISCSGVTLGRITQVPDEFEEGVINQALLRVRINNRLIADSFFKMLFRSPYFQRQMFSNTRGIAIPNVKGVKELKAIPIPLPPLAEQHRIVAEVDELMALCDQLEAQLTTAQSESQSLLESILHHALSVGWLEERKNSLN